MLLADGSIIAAGYSTGAGFAATFAKYQINGGLDLSFGDQGFLISRLLPYGVVRDLYQQKDSIYAVCTTSPWTPYSPGNIGIIKIDTRGIADESFGTSGSLKLDVDLNAWKLFIKGTSSSDLVVVGTSSSKPVLTRITATGEVAEYFKNQTNPWVVISDQPSLSEISSVAVSKANNVFMTGSTVDGNIYLSKVNTNGDLDLSFGNGSGYVTYDFGGSDLAQALYLQNDSKIVVAGASTGIESISGYAINIARFNTNGIIDTTFGNNGKLTLPGLDGGSRLLIVTDVKVDTDGSYLILYTIETASAFIRISKTGQVIAQYGAGSEGVDDFYGSDSSEILNGNAGDDTLRGGGGQDIVYGGLGEDLIVGGNGAGDDVYYGGVGSDTVKYTSAKWGITVDLSKDNGSAASLAKEKIKDAAGIGKDKLFEIENVIAGNYDDIIKGSKLVNSLYGEDGNDTIFAAGGNDYLYGGAGNDKLDGGLGDDNMAGGAGDDIYEVDSLNDTVTESLNEGNDTIRTSLTSYTLTADNVENLTYTGSLAATLTGNSSANRIIGGIGKDELSGGTGDDILSGQAGSDKLNGGDGSDTVDYSSVTTALNITLSSGAATVIVSKTETDTLTSIENIIGGSGADTLIGDSSDNSFKGAAGNDLLKGGAGNDSYYIQLGKSGNDTIVDSSGTADSFYVAGTSQGYILDFDVSTDNKQLLLNISLDKKVVQTTIFKEDDNSAITGWDIENLMLIDSGTTLNLVSAAQDSSGKIAATGTSGNEVLLGLSKDDALNGGDGIDYLFGGRGNDKLWGGSGEDYIHAGAGDDWIIGGAGADLLIGGLGADRFIYSSATEGGDRIMGFSSKDGDNIRLNNGAGGFTAITSELITSSGFLDVSAFVSSNKATAKDANDRIIFDTGTSKLYYDADGNGSGTAILLATLVGVTSLKATDIWVGDLSAI